MNFNPKQYYAQKNAQKKEEIKNYLYIDIECIPIGNQTQEEQEKYGDKIAFMPEFNKIFCICMGTERKQEDGVFFSILDLQGDEKQIINDFFAFSQLRIIVGYNIKNFDLPFIIRRAIYLGIPIPSNLKIHGMKPREVDFTLDLIEPMKYTGNNIISLDLAMKSLGLISPKEVGIDGSMVAQMVQDGKGDEVIEYCERDIKAVYEMHKKFLELNLV